MLVESSAVVSLNSSSWFPALSCHRTCTAALPRRVETREDTTSEEFDMRTQDTSGQWVGTDPPQDRAGGQGRLRFLSRPRAMCPDLCMRTSDPRRSRCSASRREKTDFNKQDVLEKDRLGRGRKTNNP